MHSDLSADYVDHPCCLIVRDFACSDLSDGVALIYSWMGVPHCVYSRRSVYWVLILG